MFHLGARLRRVECSNASRRPQLDRFHVCTELAAASLI